MSIQAMAECWGPNLPVENDRHLSASTVRLVALAVADVVNDAHDNEFYGSVTKLAAKVGLSRETVGLVMGHLCDTNVLAVVSPRPGGTTKYRWLGVTDVPSGGDGTVVRYLTEHPSGVTEPSVTNPIEPNRETNRPTQRAAAPLVVSHFGPESTEPDKREPAASRLLVDYFELQWGPVRSRNMVYGMYAVVPHRIAAYKWLNSNFFRPANGKPLALAEMKGYVDRFMDKVGNGDIVPRPEYSIWQSFVANVSKLTPDGSYTDDDDGYESFPAWNAEG